MKISLIIISAILLIGLIGIGSACSCVIPGTPAEEMNLSKLVFIGKVLNVKDISENRKEVNIDVSRVFKGNADEKIKVFTADSSASCGFNFEEDKEYLIYANKEGNDLMVSLCSRTSELSLVVDEILELENLTIKVENKSETNNNQNKTFQLSNGRNALIKIMPETASQKATERLGELGFNITLKEVGSDRVAYELTSEKEGKMLGLFKIKGEVSASVDAETGEVIKVKGPWWALLASGI